MAKQPMPVAGAPGADADHEALLEQAIDGDPAPYFARYFIIRDESGSYAPFVRNTIQADYNSKRGLRNIIVKPRKIGFTTDWLLENFLLCLTKAKACKA